MSVDPCLAVIPARGGSKGLPGKNIRPLAGLPLIAHSLRCAALCPRITRTIVSTDSEEIAAVARAHGGDVPFLRPAELAGDDMGMMPVLQHALQTAEQQDGRRYESLLLLEPTSPARFPIDVEQAFEKLAADPTADGVIGCSRPSFNPFWVGVTVQEDGVLVPAFPGTEKYVRRQDVPPFFRVNGVVYLWRREFLMKTTSSYAGRRLLLEIPESRAFSIDDADEFRLAEIMIERRMIELPWL